MNDTVVAQSSERQAFYDRIGEHSLAPLWERLHAMVTRAPVTPARLHLRPARCDRRQLTSQQPRVAGEQARTRRRHADASGGRQQLGRVEPHERVGSENGTQGLLRRLVAERRVRPAGLSHALSPAAAVQD